MALAPMERKYLAYGDKKIQNWQFEMRPFSSIYFLCATENSNLLEGNLCERSTRKVFGTFFAISLSRKFEIHLINLFCENSYFLV